MGVFQNFLDSVGLRKILNAETSKDGSTNTEHTTSGDSNISDDTSGVKDRSINLTLPRTDEGCEWAYENEISVYNAINRIDGIMNNGFDVIITHEYLKNEKAIEAQKFVERKIRDLKLRDVTSSEIKNRAIYGFSVMKIISNGNGEDISTLVPIDSKECKPIRDLITGGLGGESGKGRDGTRPTAEIAIVQKGNKVIYDTEGNPSYSWLYYYFTNEEIIAINDNDRGKFKGVSRVMRILRLIEIKKNLENTIDLITRRFGPQIWVTVGNETNNMTKSDLPPRYLRNPTTNAPIDPATARAQYKADKMTAINTEMKKWVEGNTLVQLAEFGIDAKTFNPSSSLLDYGKYIELMADFIKIGILGLDIPGRVDVTSSLMQDKLTRDVRDNVVKDRAMLEDIYNERIIEPILRANGYADDIVIIKFKPLDKMEEEKEAIIQKAISEAIYNYSKAGWIDLPENFKERFSITTEEVKAKLDPLKFVPEVPEGKQNPQSAPNTPPSTPTLAIEKARQKDLNQGR